MPGFSDVPFISAREGTTVTTAPAPQTTGVRQIELRLDVSDLIVRDQTFLAATLSLPADLTGPRTVVVAVPGGGYNRHYYSLVHPDLDGPGQAVWHGERGLIVVSLDPLGGGDSTELAPDECDLETTARVVHSAVRRLVADLRAGVLVEGVPAVDVARVVGVGHSLGGMHVVTQQGRHRTFDALAVLGWSAIQTVVPTAGGAGYLAPHSHDGDDMHSAWSGELSDESEHIRYAYHWEDVPQAIRDEDGGVGFPTRIVDELPMWITRTFPPFAAIALVEGVVSEPAAQIDVPLFLGAGERDVMVNLRNEPAAYTAATDMTLYEVPRCAHMHNFSPQRELLWRSIQTWIEGLSAR